MSPRASLVLNAASNLNVSMKQHVLPCFTFLYFHIHEDAMCHSECDPGGTCNRIGCRFVLVWLAFDFWSSAFGGLYFLVGCTVGKLVCLVHLLDAFAVKPGARVHRMEKYIYVGCSAVFGSSQQVVARGSDPYLGSSYWYH